MLGFGPPADRKARRLWWRRQIERQTQSSLSVAQFCRRHGLNPVSFYAWRRRLQDQPDISAPEPTNPATPTRPATEATFLPLAITSVGATGQLEIELGNACTVRLHGSVDPRLLRVAIRTAGELARTTPGERP